MSKPKGLPKSGGRIKGVPNKKSHFIKHYVEDNNIDILGEMFKIISSSTSEQKMDYFFKLLPYIYPKRNNLDPPVSQLSKDLFELDF